MRRWSLLLFGSIFFVTSVLGQKSEMYFKSFTIEDGLSQNSVYAIAQTKEGFIWAGTIDGLNRFDGNAFKAYKPEIKEGVTRSSLIYSLLVDHNNNLLVGTSQELLIFDTSIEAFVKPESKIEGLVLPTNIGVKELFQDADSNLWILTQGYGIYRYDDKTHELSLFLNDEPIKNNIPGICQNSASTIFIATDNKVFYYDNGDLLDLKLKERSNLSINNIRSIEALNNDLYLGIQDEGLLQITPSLDSKHIIRSIKGSPKDIVDILSVEDNNLWIASRSNGVFNLDINSGVLTQAKRGKKIIELRSNFVLSLFKDLGNNVWLGLSGGGLSYNLQDYAVFENITPNELSKDPNGDNMVFGICQYENDIFYMGSLNKGLKEYNRRLDKVEYHVDPDLPNEMLNIYGVLKIENTLWLATWAGLCNYEVKNRKFSDLSKADHSITKLYSIYQIDDERLFLGGENGMVVYNMNSELYEPIQNNLYDLKQLIPLYIDKFDDQHILLCTSNASIVKYNLSTKEIIYFTNILEISSSARYFHLTDKDCWIATDNGLIQTDKKSFDIKKVWTTKDGLANDFIYAVHADQDGNIWLSTNNGLSQINAENNKVINYGLANGLQSLEFNSASCLYSDQGELFFGGINGLNIIKPDHLEVKTILKQPQITDISVMNKSLITDSSHTVLSNLKLKQNERLLSLEFVSPDHFKSNDITYAYKLEGVDNEWIDLGKRTSINFTHLGPGDYTFGVKAKDKDGNSSPENTNLKITVLPQLWQTLWFRILAFLLLGLIVFLFWLNSIKSLEKKHKFEEQISKLELSALRSQMNPHFIFNTLNSIKYHSIYKSRDETSEYIVDFSSLIRKILENSKHMEISLRQEIELIELYVNLEKKRMKKEFDFDLNVDGKLNIDNYHIPPMIIQPFIENAIWHGLMTKVGDKKLALNFKKCEDGFMCEIDDNGVGRNKNGGKANNKKESLGITITEDRLSKLNGINDTENTIDIIDKVDGSGNSLGTKVIIKMTNQIQ